MAEQVTRYKLEREGDSVETLFADVRDDYIARGWTWVNDPSKTRQPASPASPTVIASKKPAKNED